MSSRYENPRDASRRREEPRRMEIEREWKIDPREGVPVCRDDDCPKCRASLSHHADIPKHERGYIDEEMTERWKKVARGDGASEQEVNSLRRRLDESSHTIDRLRGERDEARREAHDMREDLRRMRRELDDRARRDRSRSPRARQFAPPPPRYESGARRDGGLHGNRGRQLARHPTPTGPRAHPRMQPISAAGGHGGPRTESVASRSTTATTRVEGTSETRDADVIMNDDSGVKGESAPANESSNAPGKAKCLYRGPESDAEDDYGTDDDDDKGPKRETSTDAAMKLRARATGVDPKHWITWITSSNKALGLVELMNDPRDERWFRVGWKRYESGRTKPKGERSRVENWVVMYLDQRPLYVREKLYKEKKGAHLPQFTEHPNFWADYFVLKSAKCPQKDREIPSGIVINDKGALSKIHIKGRCYVHGWQPSKPPEGTSLTQTSHVRRILRRVIACPGLIVETIKKHKMIVRQGPVDLQATKLYPTNGANDGVIEMARWLADLGVASWELDEASGFCQEYIRHLALKLPAESEKGIEAREDAKWVSRWMVNVQSTSSAVAAARKASDNWISVIDSDVIMRELTKDVPRFNDEKHIMPPGEEVPSITDKGALIDEYTNDGNSQAESTGLATAKPADEAEPQKMEVDNTQ